MILKFYLVKFIFRFVLGDFNFFNLPTLSADMFLTFKASLYPMNLIHLESSNPVQKCTIYVKGSNVQVVHNVSQ